MSLYTVWTVELHQPEAIFWRCTPRKITAMWREHLRLNGLLKEDADDAENEDSGEVVTRGGKQYKKVDPAKASWLYE